MFLSRGNKIRGNANSYQLDNSLPILNGLTAYWPLTMLNTGRQTNAQNNLKSPYNTMSASNTTDGGFGSLNGRPPSVFIGGGQTTWYDSVSNPVADSDSITFAGWFAIEDSTGGFGGIALSRGSDDSSVGWSAYILAKKSSAASFQIVTTSGGAAGYGATGTTLLSSSTWYRIMGTFNQNTGVIKVYLNGRLEGTGSSSGTNTLRSSGVSIRIGHMQTSQWWCGWISDIMIWKRALSDAEAAEDYRLSKNWGYYLPGGRKLRLQGSAAASPGRNLITSPRRLIIQS